MKVYFFIFSCKMAFNSTERLKERACECESEMPFHPNRSSLSPYIGLISVSGLDGECLAGALLYYYIK